jgi:hypothetical protein
MHLSLGLLGALLLSALIAERRVDVAAAIELCSPTTAATTPHPQYKVYVYEISPSLSMNSENARADRSFHVCKKCIYEQFSLEYVIHDYLTQFCGRTYNPEEADFFYLPIIRDVDYRIALQSGDRKPSLIDSAMIEALEKGTTTQWNTVFNVTDKYWHKNGGERNMCSHNV